MRWFNRYGVRVIENQAIGLLETRFYNRKGELLELPKNDGEKSE